MEQNIIKTPHLTLEVLREDDYADVIGLMLEPEVGKTYMVPDLPSEEKKRALFERLRGMSLSEERFLRGLYLDGRLIGLIHEVKAEAGEVEVGYLLRTDAWNRGYMTEALTAVIPVFFERGFSVVKAGAFSENRASMRVMEKSGMVCTGEEEDIDYRGATHRCLYYAIRKP